MPWCDSEWKRNNGPFVEFGRGVQNCRVEGIKGHDNSNSNPLLSNFFPIVFFIIWPISFPDSFSFLVTRLKVSAKRRGRNNWRKKKSHKTRFVFYFRRIRSPSIASELLTTRYNIFAFPTSQNHHLISSHLHRKHTNVTTRASRGENQGKLGGKRSRKGGKRERERNYRRRRASLSDSSRQRMSSTLTVLRKSG